MKQARFKEWNWDDSPKGQANRQKRLEARATGNKANTKRGPIRSWLNVVKNGLSVVKIGLSIVGIAAAVTIQLIIILVIVGVL